MSPDAALALCRFLHNSATMLVWGGFAFVATLVPRGLAAAVGATCPRLGAIGIATAVATTFAGLPLEAAAIGDGWAAATDPATLRAVLTESAVGRSWQVQAVAALLLAAAPLVPGGRRRGAVAVAAGLLLATLATTGHAAMHEGPMGLLHRLSDTLHLLAGGAWLGALVPLLAILKRLDEARFRPDAIVALRRFSCAGHAAVALVLATGVANTVLVLDRWPTNWASPYLDLLAVKIVLVMGMAAIALSNRYLLVPRMGVAPEATVRALRRSTLAAIALGVGVTGLVAIFGLLDPA